MKWIYYMGVENGVRHLQREKRTQTGDEGRRAGEGAQPNAVIGLHNGVPSLTLSGKLAAPLVVDLDQNAGAQEQSAAFAAGVRLFRLCGVDLGWKGAAQFDYQKLDARIESLLNSAPSANFLIDVDVDAPEWWRKAHPGECAEYLENTEQNRGMVVSWASLSWRNEAGSALARLVRHVHKGVSGAQCIGWSLASGEAGEWRRPMAADLPDVGPAMTAYFRKWAAEKYRRNTGLLRKAWFDARIEFPDIRCPDARERRRGDYGVLRNPQRSKRTLDYYESLADAQNSAALHFCSQARRASEGRALIGLSFATVAESGMHPENGHGLPETVLDSPDVQFLANQGAADGSYVRALTGSLALRGKLLFHGVPRNQSADRAAALALTHHLGLTVPANTSPALLGVIQDAMERSLPLSAKARRRVSPIAVVVDMPNRHFIAETAEQQEPLNAAMLTAQIEQLSRTGTPFDLHLLSDLFHPKFPDYKIVMFLNTFYVSEAERRRVDARVKRSGITAVWLWGAGLIGEEGVSSEYGRRLCGQKVRVETGGISLRVRIAEGNDPLTWGLHPGTQFGPDRAISPTVTISDKAVTRLGANTDNKTVFAALRGEEWTSVVFGTSVVPASLLRNLLRSTGAHLYLDTGSGAQVSADSRSVAIYAPRGGQHHISLPGRFDVTEGWSGRVIARGVSDFDENLAPGQTAYFELVRRGDSADMPQEALARSATSESAARPEERTRKSQPRRPERRP